MRMLTKAVVTTILPVKDMDRARDFYEKKLGSNPGDSQQTGIMYLPAGAKPRSRSLPSQKAPRLSTRH